MIEALSISPDSLARELGLPLEQVEGTLALLTEGYPVPFIARFRKDQTRNLSEENVARVAVAYQKLRQLSDRKLSFLKTIDAQGKLTPELEGKIREAADSRLLEDLYLPYKSKRDALAQAARDKGLEPLALAILNAEDETSSLSELANPYADAEKGVADADAALKGAADIIAEHFAETFELRRAVRDEINRNGKLVVQKAEKESVEPDAAAEAAPSVEAAPTPEPVVSELPAEGSDAPSVSAEPENPEQTPEQKVKTVEKKKKKSLKERRQEQLAKQFASLFGASFPIRNCPAHRALAINRGEGCKILAVTLDFDVDALKKTARELLVDKTRPYAEFLGACVDDALTRLAAPAIKSDARHDLTERAEEEATFVCGRNLRNLLLQRPVEGRRILAINPDLRDGCKLVALDETGAPLGYEVVFLQGSDERIEFATSKMIEMIDNYQLSVVAIGSGMGSREAEVFVAGLIEKNYADKDVAYIVVNEAGATAYSTSQVAKDELPDYDAGARAAVSIGRRVQNPLNELVKIDPEKLGVGMYQHDVRPRVLKDALETVLTACVSKAGVDLNAASPAALRYVAGLNQLTAKRVYERRVEKGPYQNIEQLKEIPGINGASFAHCAGFLRIADGSNPLDATWIHPENYELATKILEKLGLSPDDLRDPAKRDEVASKVGAADANALAEEFAAGPLAVADILEQFSKPGSDPREALHGPIFKKGSMKLEDLKPGMEIVGSIVNVVDFGVFVDVGVHELGLVHISRLGAPHVRDASRLFFVGDVMRVRVLEVDEARRRISLAAVERGPKERRFEGGRRPRRENEDGASRRERRPRRDDDNREERRRERPRRDGGNRDDRAPRSMSFGPKEKEITPISEEMKSGKEPMRSFSDLAQLFGRIQASEGDKKKSGEGKKKNGEEKR